MRVCCLFVRSISVYPSTEITNLVPRVKVYISSTRKRVSCESQPNLDLNYTLGKLLNLSDKNGDNSTYLRG